MKLVWILNSHFILYILYMCIPSLYNVARDIAIYPTVKCQENDIINENIRKTRQNQ